MLASWYVNIQNRIALALRGREDEEKGQGMVEYALILVLIAIVVIVILSIVGRRVSDVMSNVSNGLNQG